MRKIMSILDDLRTHLIDLEIVESKQCKKNLGDDSEDLTVLWIYGGYKEIIGDSPTIQIKTFSKNAVTAEERIKKIFEALVSDKPIRISTINNKKMKIVESQQPFFIEKDTQQRFVWAFNITVTAFSGK